MYIAFKWISQATRWRKDLSCGTPPGFALVYGNLAVETGEGNLKLQGSCSTTHMNKSNQGDMVVSDSYLQNKLTLQMNKLFGYVIHGCTGHFGLFNS